MARYISSAQRRRKALVLAVVALVVGLAVGFGVAKLSTTSIEDRVASVRSDAQQATSGLSVLALHAQNHLETNDVKPVLATTRADLVRIFGDAPWLGATTQTSLLAEIDALSAMSPKAASFATALTAARDHIDAAFGVVDH